MLEGNVDLRQPQFLAIIEDDVAAQRTEQQHLHPPERAALLGRRPARDRAWRVVILERPARPAHARRSEEHTSELQSLMRISYAVFCLKKKTPTSTHQLQLSTN